MPDSTCRVVHCTNAVHHKRNQLCKMHQSRWERNGTTDKVRQPALLKPCAVDGCKRLTRTGSADLCKMHYHRKYRHGDVSMVGRETDVTNSHGRRYRTIYVPGHELASKHGMAYEHRVVLHEAIGPGEHACHWCGIAVTWSIAPPAVGALSVDHLNGIGDDNRPANLVPSCAPCNSTRGSQGRHRALVAAGFWSNNDTVARTTKGRAQAIA